MRVILVFLILFLWAGRSFDEELIMGRVVSIDKSTGSVALEVLDGPEKMMQEVKKPGAQPYRITVAKEALPGPVAENSVVRVWGTFDENNRQFRPVRVYTENNSGGSGGGQREHGYGRTKDLTGVRQRIGRGAGAGGSRGSTGGAQQGSGGGRGGRGGR